MEGMEPSQEPPDDGPVAVATLVESSWDKLSAGREGFLNSVLADARALTDLEATDCEPVFG